MESLSFVRLHGFLGLFYFGSWNVNNLWCGMEASF